MENHELKWGLARRFEFIEWRLYWVGRINRGDLEDRFGVSTPQASLDLRAYAEAAPGNIEYAPSEKAYIPKRSFRPLYLRLSADHYLLQLNAILNGAVATTDTWFGSPPAASVIQTITRSIEPNTLRAILEAIEKRLALDIDYQSLSRSQRRWIAPHSLAFDGHRWHARGWCAEHNDFRDFVLSRILSVVGSRQCHVDPTNDVEWNTIVELEIVAHPKLDDAQRSAIERDYGMRNRKLVIKTRAALSFYLIRRLSLDISDDAVGPERKQIFLANAIEVEGIQRTAKFEATKRLAASTAGL